MAFHRDLLSPSSIYATERGCRLQYHYVVIMRRINVLACGSRGTRGGGEYVCPGYRGVMREGRKAAAPRFRNRTRHEWFDATPTVQTPTPTPSLARSRSRSRSLRTIHLATSGPKQQHRQTANTVQTCINSVLNTFFV